MPLFPGRRGGGIAQAESDRGSGQQPAGPTRTPATIYSETCPPHEMSYSTIEKLQYGESQAQESQPPRPHVPGARSTGVHIYLRRVWTVLTFVTTRRPFRSC